MSLQLSVLWVSEKASSSVRAHLLFCLPLDRRDGTDDRFLKVFRMSMQFIDRIPLDQVLHHRQGFVEQSDQVIGITLRAVDPGHTVLLWMKVVARAYTRTGIVRAIAIRTIVTAFFHDAPPDPSREPSDQEPEGSSMDQNAPIRATLPSSSAVSCMRAQPKCSPRTSTLYPPVETLT